MPTDRTSLDIEIRTVADLQGIRLTEDQLQRVKERVQQLRHATEDNTRITDQEREALRARAQEALRNLEADEKGAGTKRKATDASAALTKELRGLQQAGQGLNGVFEGLSQGGLGGFIQAGRGALQLLRGMGSALVNLGPAAIAVGAALKALDLAAQSNQNAIARAYQSHAEASAKAAASLEADTKKMEQALDRVILKIQKSAAAFDDLQQRSDRAEKRVSATNAANRELDLAQLDEQEKAALARASTPEARDSISREFALRRKDVDRRFEQAELEGAGLQAGVRRQQALDEQARQRRLVDQADAQVRAAEDEFNAAKAEADIYAPTDTRAPVEALRKQALAKRSALEAAQKKRDEVAAAAGEVFQRTSAQIEQADLDISLTGTRSRTAGSRSRARISDLQRQTQEGAAAVEAADRGVSSIERQIAGVREGAARGGFGATADTSGLERELAAARAERDRLYQTFVKDSRDSRKEMEALQRQLKNTREQRGGGG